MNRNIVYPGAIPLETDILSVNRQTMIALGYLIRATVGTGVAVDGLDCVPTIPPSMTVRVAPGSMVQNSVVDTVPYGSLGADPNSPLMKMGINLAPHSFDLVAPVDAGKTVVYLIQASMQESDEGMLVLPYYNAANPVQPFSGPTNSGLPQATSRNQYVQLQLKAGVPLTTGTQLPPVEDQGWTGLYLITVSNGQTVIAANSIKVLPTAPFLGHKLSSLKPGFGSGVQTFMVDGGFVVPAQVTQVEVEVWGGGSGTYASAPGKPSGGGSGGSQPTAHARPGC